MKRTPVNSSTVVSVGWEDGTLELEFASGGIYQYENVPKETFEGFMRAESKGHFFQVGIRPCYECVRLHIEGCGVPRNETCGPLTGSPVQTCSCWCHKQRKDVSQNAPVQKSESPQNTRKPIRNAKRKHRV